MARSPDVGERRRFLREAETSHDLRVVPLVLRLAEADPDPSVKLRADSIRRVLTTRVERVMDLLGVHRSTPPRPIAPAGRKRLTDADARERRDAVLELIERRERHRVGELLAALQKEDEGWVRCEIADALGKLGTAHEAGEALVGLLADPVSRVRANAAEALGTLRPRGFEARLEPLLEDPDRRVRGNALVALAGSPSPVVEKALDRLVESRDPLDQKSALFALKRFEGKFAESRLRVLAASEDPSVRKAAEEALASLVPTA